MNAQTTLTGTPPADSLAAKDQTATSPSSTLLSTVVVGYTIEHIERILRKAFPPGNPYNLRWQVFKETVHHLLYATIDFWSADLGDHPEQIFLFLRMKFGSSSTLWGSPTIYRILTEETWYDPGTSPDAHSAPAHQATRIDISFNGPNVWIDELSSTRSEGVQQLKAIMRAFMHCPQRHPRVRYCFGKPIYLMNPLSYSNDTEASREFKPGCWEDDPTEN